MRISVLLLLVLSHTAAAQPPQAAQPVPHVQLSPRIAHYVLRGGSLAALQRRYEQRSRRLTTAGATLLLVGLGTLVAAASLGSGCDDDDYVCIPAGPALAIPGAAASLVGAIMIGLGAKNRNRGRRLQLALGVASAKIHLHF